MERRKKNRREKEGEECEREKNVLVVGSTENVLVLVNIRVFCNRFAMVLVKSLLRRESSAFVGIIIRWDSVFPAKGTREENLAREESSSRGS